MLTKLLRRSVEVQRREDRRRHDLKWQRRRQEEEDLLRGAVNVQAFASAAARRPHRHTRAHRLEEKRAALHAREVAASGKEETPREPPALDSHTPSQPQGATPLANLVLPEDSDEYASLLSNPDLLKGGPEYAALGLQPSMSGKVIDRIGGERAEALI